MDERTVNGCFKFLDPLAEQACGKLDGFAESDARYLAGSPKFPRISITRLNSSPPAKQTLERRGTQRSIFDNVMNQYHLGRYNDETKQRVSSQQASPPQQEHPEHADKSEFESKSESRARA